MANEANFETITSNKLAIERGSLIAGDISFQIRNIASLLVSEVENKSSGFLAILLMCLGAFLGGAKGVGTAIAGACVGFVVAVIIQTLSTKYQLRLLTNAATSFKLIHKDKQFLLRLKQALEEVMQRNDSTIAYHVNIGEQKIDRIEANTTHVSNSPHSTVIGGSAEDVRIRQSNTIISKRQGLQDIDALLKLIENSNTEHREFFEYHLRVVQQHFAGIRKKEEAKTSWAEFIKYVGIVAQSGSKVWELVERIGSAISI